MNKVGLFAISVAAPFQRFDQIMRDVSIDRCCGVNNDADWIIF